MRISDWSSDVCSSDLELTAAGLARLLEHLGDEALAPVLWGAGADAEIIVAAVGHGCAPCKLWRVRSCEARGHACIGAGLAPQAARWRSRSEEHTSELQSLMRISYAVFCLKKKKN